MRTVFYEGGRQRDTLVVSYFPLNGSAHNTGPRYKQEAELTGFDILGVARPGSDTFKFSPRQRLEFSPRRFDEACAADAEVIDKIAESYKTVIWRGQSSGSFPALSIIKNNLARATHLLLEDGITTGVSRAAAKRDWLDYRLDWWRYVTEEQAKMPRPAVKGRPEVPGLPHEDWREPDWSRGSARETVAKFVVEQAHWSSLWRSSYGHDALIKIAENRPELPILAKFMGHTAMTTGLGVVDMRLELDTIQQLRRETHPNGAAIQTSYDPEGWHGYIIYPQFGAANLQEVAAMQEGLAAKVTFREEQ